VLRRNLLKRKDNKFSFLFLFIIVYTEKLIFSDLWEKKLSSKFENIFTLSVKDLASALIVIFSWVE